MRVKIPDNIPTSDLKRFPAGPYGLVFKDCSVKPAKTSGKPKMTIRWLCTTEPEGGDEAFTDLIDNQGKSMEPFPTVGEVVLDTYSLQEQALWRLNDLHIAALGGPIPADDYSPEEFQAYISEKFAGIEGIGLLVDDVDQNGNPMTKIEAVSF